MKNLFERLKPEVKEIIEQELVDFPYTMKNIKEDLIQNYLVGDIKYSNFITLSSFYHKANNKTANTAWDLFND